MQFQSYQTYQRNILQKLIKKITKADTLAKNDIWKHWSCILVGVWRTQLDDDVELSLDFQNYYTLCKSIFATEFFCLENILIYIEYKTT